MINIMLIEDEEILLKIIKRLLVKNGYNIIDIDNYSDAVKIFNESPDKFDLILTDYHLTEKTGIDLAEKLLSIKKIPIILITGDDTVKERDALKMGIRKVLYKPFRIEKLNVEITNILEMYNY